MRILIILYTFAVFCSCSSAKPKKELKTKYNRIPIANVKFYDHSLYGTNFSDFNSDECKQSYLKISLTDFDLAQKYDKTFRANTFNPLLRIKVRYNDTISEFILNPLIDTLDNLYTRTVKNKTLIGYVPYHGGEIEVSMSYKMIKADEQLNNILKAIRAPLNFIPVDQLIYGAAYEFLNHVDSISADQRNIFSFNITLDEDKRRNLKEGFYLAHENRIDLSASDVLIDKDYDTYKMTKKDTIPLNKITSYAVFEFEEIIEKEIEFIKDKSIKTQYRKMEKSLNRISVNVDSMTKIAVNDYLNFNDKLIDSDEITRYDKHVISQLAFTDLLKEIGRNTEDYKPQFNWLSNPCPTEYDTSIVERQTRLNEKRMEGFSRKFNLPLYNEKGDKIEVEDLEPRKREAYKRWIEDTGVDQFLSDENKNDEPIKYEYSQTFELLKDDISFCDNPVLFIINNEYKGMPIDLRNWRVTNSFNSSKINSTILESDFKSLFPEVKTDDISLAVIENKDVVLSRNYYHPFEIFVKTAKANTTLCNDFGSLDSLYFNIQCEHFDDRSRYIMSHFNKMNVFLVTHNSYESSFFQVCNSIGIELDSVSIDGLDYFETMKKVLSKVAKYRDNPEIALLPFDGGIFDIYFPVSKNDPRINQDPEKIRTSNGTAFMYYVSEETAKSWGFEDFKSKCFISTEPVEFKEPIAFPKYKQTLVSKIERALKKYLKKFPYENYQ